MATTTGEATAGDTDRAPDASRASGSATRAPYARSWVNVLTARLERLPGPTWLAYAVAMLAGTLFSAVGTGLATAPAPGSEAWSIAGLGPAAYYGSLPFAMIGLIHLLDRSASRAVEILRPDLSLDDAGAADLRYRLTVAPARPVAVLTVLAGVITVMGYAADPVSSGIVGYSAPALAFRWAWESLVTAIFLVLILHTIRQLGLIGGIHRDLARVDIFDQGPLYSMSRVTSTTAMGLIVLLFPSVALLPTNVGTGYLVFTAAFFGLTIVIAGAAFFLPLRGIHARLVDEKRRLHGAVGRRISAAAAALNAAVDAGDGPGIDLRHRTLSALIAERDLVHRTPTWPWSNGAITGVVSAILLPLVLFLIQRSLAAILPG